MHTIGCARIYLVNFTVDLGSEGEQMCDLLVTIGGNKISPWWQGG